jgi:hypothetical protein
MLTSSIRSFGEGKAHLREQQPGPVLRAPQIVCQQEKLSNIRRTQAPSAPQR